MDLDKDIQVINSKDKIFSPEERHKWKMQELPPVPKDNNRNILVSIKELVYGRKEAGVGTSAKSLNRCNELLSSSEEVHGPRKDRGSFEGLGPEEGVGPRKGQQPSGSFPSLHNQKSTLTSAKQGQANTKDKSEGQEKGRAQVEQALPTEIQNSQEREDSHGKCVQYGKNSDGIQKQGGGMNEPIIFKEIDLVNLVNHFETCNKETLAKLSNSGYIQKNMGREILQVEESQKTIIGLESVNKDNILSLTQICARIESKATLLH
ncbi:hypothetical protein O181_105191 [Austropuccinia psidii MF-1]|uniref:Uncharacterized protein n=1 Tax=Austropuccinia psidii MF-1 TaxID=1389203 RepID=A0A9Q3PM23_9BASI|nr:hypothetical protein [Austropuccinia psidii MF-1]